MQSKLYYDLLEIIEKQEGMITKQNDMISKLVNENVEKENIIKVLTQEEEFLY